MMRTRVIRLAATNPNLRPHLLRLLVGTTTAGMVERVASQHLAFIRLPKDAFSFKFSGPGAEAKGRMLAQAVAEAVEMTRLHANTIWQNLSDRFDEVADVDANPEISRNFVGLALQDTHALLARRAVPYFERVEW